MAVSDDERKWLSTAIFAKTNNGFWLAWHPDDFSTICALVPGKDTADWIDSFEPETPESWIEYFQSDGYINQPVGVMNLFIENPETGEWE